MTDPRETLGFADERAVLDVMLDFHRAALLRKSAGLSDDDLRRQIVPSGTTILGLVKHLAAMERTWFRNAFANEGVAEIWQEDDPEADLRVQADETSEYIFGLYRAEVDAARKAIANASLDEHARSGAPFSLRVIFAHMIEETARHNGHVDVLRELIDGVVGE